MAVSREDSVNQLQSTIRDAFEKNGVLQEVRCHLQSKMVALMQGNSKDSKTLVKRSNITMGVANTSRDSRIFVLNQLIFEYLHWHGFHYTAEMFSMENGTDNVPPMRQCLESVVGKFNHPNLPILLELVSGLIERHKHETEQQEHHHTKPKQQRLNEEPNYL